MKNWALITSAAIAIATVGGASAQDISGQPYFGSANLSAGFTPDPHTVSITAGGSNDAAYLGTDCVGMVGDNPDFDLYYTAGGLPLYISATSSADLTLAVNTPDGRWVCNDDSGGDLNPGLVFSNPQSGMYNIFVGRYGATDMPSATLYISETNLFTN